MLSKIYSTNTKYTKLLISILVILIFSPLNYYFDFVESIFSLFFFIAIIFAINTLSFSPRLIFLSRLVVMISLVGSFFENESSILLYKLLNVIPQISFSVFVLIAILGISARLVREQKVNSDVIRGSICLYLMLGILWYFFFKIVYILDVNSFVFNNEEDSNHLNDLLYFSFTTLTTLGYGDISPINPFAMMFANLEAFVGQLYPAIFIAKLVSLYDND